MNKKMILYMLPVVLTGTMHLLAQGGNGNGNGNGKGDVTVLVPDSSIENPGDRGHKAHTNHVIALRPGRVPSSPSGETPGSIRPVYDLPSTGGSGIIAIVDAYDYPTAEADLNTFSSQFGLPACTTADGCFKIIKVGSPRANCGWAQEAALDIEWAHAMAPNAKIVLVEANSNSFADLLEAVDVANNYIASSGGGGEVSMSWGGSEFADEAAYDSHFNTSGIVYFAASGDTGGKTIYPGVSPNVVSAGGTRINRDSNGSFVTETGWSGSGGGPSKYEPRPTYQSVIPIVSDQRLAPDFSFDADPNSGVSVFDSTKCQGMSGWMVFGGTSVSSPALAGIVNLAGHFNPNSSMELGVIYFSSGNASAFRDITSGTAGGYSATAGWDFVTGVGSNQGLQGK